MVCRQLVIERARFGVGRIHEELGLMVADRDDYPASLIGGALLEGHERVEHLEALGALVDHIARHDQDGVTAAPVNGAWSALYRVDQMVLGEERDHPVIATMDIADREDRGAGVDLDHRRVRRPIAGTRRDRVARGGRAGDRQHRDQQPARGSQVSQHHGPRPFVGSREITTPRRAGGRGVPPGPCSRPAREDRWLGQSHRLGAPPAPAGSSSRAAVTWRDFHGSSALRVSTAGGAFTTSAPERRGGQSGSGPPAHRLGA